VTAIGGHEALTRKTLRQAIRSLAQALDDPRYDDWDDDMILTILGEIITRRRKQRDTEIFTNLSGAQVIPSERLHRGETNG
jgi:hypothetical protein